MKKKDKAEREVAQIPKREFKRSSIKDPVKGYFKSMVK